MRLLLGMTITCPGEQPAGTQMLDSGKPERQTCVMPPPRHAELIPGHLQRPLMGPSGAEQGWEVMGSHACPAAHTFAQPPQWLGSEEMSTQPPLQQRVPGAVPHLSPSGLFERWQ